MPPTRKPVTSKPKSAAVEVVDNFGLTDNASTPWITSDPMDEKKSRKCKGTNVAGEPCKKAPMKGRDFCRNHGGRALRGVASPSWKHGKYSADIPSRMASRFDASLNDPNQLAINADIALVDARIGDLLARVDTGEAGTAWKQAEEINGKIQKAVHNNDYGELMILSLKLDRVIGDARTDVESWSQIMQLIEQRRKLIESEQKRLVAGQQMMSYTEAMAMFGAMFGIIRENVADMKTRQAIISEMQKLVTVGAQ